MPASEATATEVINRNEVDVAREVDVSTEIGSAPGSETATNSATAVETATGELATGERAATVESPDAASEALGDSQARSAEAPAKELADDELSLPEPRSFAHAATLFGCLATVPFVLLWSWLFSWFSGQSFLHVLPYGVGAGVLFGMTFGAAMGYLFQGAIVAIEVSGRRDFERRLKAAMAQVGYRPDVQTEDCFVFQPTARAGWGAGTLWVGVEGERGVVVGPKIYVNRVIKQLDPNVAWR